MQLTAIEYRIYDADGSLVDDWDINPDRIDSLTVPTHGSLHIKYGDGWLNIRTSEWIVTDFSHEPKPWGA